MAILAYRRETGLENAYDLYCFTGRKSIDDYLKLHSDYEFEECTVDEAYEMFKKDLFNDILEEDKNMSKDEFYNFAKAYQI